jgi:hypothetical protein
MKTHKVVVAGVVLAGILLMLQAPLRMVAQEPPPQEQGPEHDPPGRVARLSFSVGSVSFQPGGEGDWVQAVRNRPLSTGDNLWADKDSRAELQTGSTSIRIDSETSVTLLDLDDHNTQLKLSQGSVIVRVRHLDEEDHFEIDTPNLAFQIQRTGEYRIDVNSDGSETDATVWHGRGEATGGGNSYVVVANQRARFTGTDQLDHEIDQIPDRDDFDDWAFERDHREDHAESSNYISPEMTGAEDLDEYGHWHYAAGYGPVWAPTEVGPGWAPYRYGHWVWVEPWGWTWVEDEPWGFAPFHYGRWAYVDEGWCWVPGPVYSRPVYAPALVAFVGGGGFSVGVGIGAGVAWFPLAPREVYVPWYRTSPGYVNNVNVTNTNVNVTQVTNVYNTTVINNNRTVNNTVINNNTVNNTTTNNNVNVTRINYANQHVTNAVTAVPHDTFVNARPVAANMVKVDAKQIAEAPVTHTIAVQPVKASVVGAGRPTPAQPPAAAVNRQVVATRQPPPPRAPFEQRQTAKAMPNVRTEAPGQPQSAARAPNEAPRPAQPVTRPNEVTRPQPPANQPSHPQPPANPASNRPMVAPNAPRPAAAQPEAARQPEPARPAERSVPHPPTAEGGHPLVRPAPPVQENPQHQQNEQAKFNAWQQQRQSSPPREAARPPEPPHPQPRAPQPPPHQTPHR